MIIEKGVAPWGSIKHLLFFIEKQLKMNNTVFSWIFQKLFDWYTIKACGIIFLLETEFFLFQSTLLESFITSFEPHKEKIMTKDPLTF